MNLPVRLRTRPQQILAIAHHYFSQLPGNWSIKNWLSARASRAHCRLQRKKDLSSKNEKATKKKFVSVCKYLLGASSATFHL